jgi:membrane protease YdiL (CAAX protease family)
LANRSFRWEEAGQPAGGCLAVPGVLSSQFFPDYVIFGFLLALVAMRTNSLETAFGVHLANNVFC